jgi:hypothetical protein
MCLTDLDAFIAVAVAVAVGVIVVINNKGGIW